MRNNSMVAAVVAVLLVVGLGFAYGGGVGQAAADAVVQGPHGPGGPHGGGLEKLNLTQEQRQKLDQLMEADRAANREQADQMRDLHRQLQQAIFGGEGEASAIAEQINELQAKLLQARIAHLQKVAAILTPEQRAQMATMPMPGPGRMRPGGPWN